MNLKRPISFKVFLSFSFCIFYASALSAQEVANSIRICGKEYFQTDELGRLLNHLPYPEAGKDTLVFHKFGNNRHCRTISKDMQEDLMALLEASRVPTQNALYAHSCFRSFETQDRVFCSKVFRENMAIRTRALQSAPKGYSEHSTGLAVDFGDAKHPKYNLEQEFINTPSAKWLMANAHKYGFELSFPQNNKQGITFEPWHWRWVGDGHSNASFRARATFALAQENFPSPKKNDLMLGNHNRFITPVNSQISIKPVEKIYAPKKASLDPNLIGDDDFKRLWGKSVWDGLYIERDTFQDGRANWALWRITNIKKPNGPLWFGAHDNENAAFPALVHALKRYGGRGVFVDTGPRDTNNNARMNENVLVGSRIDPNRYFKPDSLYTKKVLRDLDSVSPFIFAVHTNSKGFNGEESDCNKTSEFANGRGVISALFCNETMQPYKSKTNHYPFDDDDSIAIVPYKYTQSPKDAFCAKPLKALEFNIGFERVTKQTDGSLSNYSLIEGIKYINLETLDLGHEPDQINNAAKRAGVMIDYVMKFCPIR